MSNSLPPLRGLRAVDVVLSRRSGIPSTFRASATWRLGISVARRDAIQLGCDRDKGSEGGYFAISRRQAWVRSTSDDYLLRTVPLSVRSVRSEDCRTADREVKP